MEIKRKKQRSISNIFLKYICVLAGGALFWLALLALLLIALTASGQIIPANSAELQLNETAEEFRNAPKITEDMLPLNCTYGVYRNDGSWLYGTFSEEEKHSAWEHYQERNLYSYGNRFYRFFYRDTGEVCIVSYELAAQFRNAFLRKYLPGAEAALLILYVFLFLVHTVVVSRSFGKYMKKKLSVLNKVTEEIRNQNLEFEKEHSEIKEIEEVLDSLHQMKESLRESLYRQWDLEKSKEEQVAALAHDIKTPLTTIRGNAELLAEGELGREEQEYDRDILQSVEMLEEYLTMLNGIVLAGEDMVEKRGERQISCEELADKLEEQARLLAAARQSTIVFDRQAPEKMHGEIWCNESQMVRAFQNIVSNALDYNPPGKEIQIKWSVQTEKGKEYLAVVVQDAGPGFSAEDLKHASERFYQGDKSRSSKAHYGIGLHTAQTFLQAQGGRLVIENRENGGGKVTLYIRVCCKDEVD